jgi:4-nitrophenyl phosphatase
VEITNTERLKAAGCFLFDMDGTIYLGDRLLPGAAEVVDFLQRKGTPFYFLTNNSARARGDYAAKLCRLGLNIEEAAIFTSGEATALYLQRMHAGARLCVIGTPSLEQEMVDHGFTLEVAKPDAVVLGFDTGLTYSKLWRLCDHVRAGLPYFATHPDFNCPTETGYMPDIGAVIAFVKASTGRDPDCIIGKPNAPIVRAISEKTGVPVERLVMVGDRLYTDIALGQAGLAAILVLSGETRAEDVGGSLYQPDIIVAGVDELLELLQET